MFVRDWMSAPAITLPPGTTAASALAFMEKRKIRRVPVVQDGKLVGIVTRSDLMGPGKRMTQSQVATVSQVMTRNPVFVSQEDTLETAAQVMLARKISGIPVLDEERVVGIITESDLFRALCGMLGIGERGARVVMNVRDDADLLEKIQGRLNGLMVRSLVTVHD